MTFSDAALLGEVCACLCMLSTARWIGKQYALLEWLGAYAVSSVCFNSDYREAAVVRWGEAQTRSTWHAHTAVELLEEAFGAEV